jgi:hypothetical protein
MPLANMSWSRRLGGWIRTPPRKLYVPMAASSRYRCRDIGLRIEAIPGGDVMAVMLAS